MLVLVVTFSNLTQGDVHNVAQDFSQIMQELEIVVNHPRFNAFEQITQYKVLKAVLGMVHNYINKKIVIIDTQLLNVNDAPSCRFC